MTRINTNVPSLRGLRSLAKANKLLDQSLTRLSTGVQINSGKDNPAGLIASETLRSQLTVIDQSIKNTNRANNVISTADSALGEIGTLLNQVRGLVQEGLNEGALSSSEIEANQGQIDAALSAINKISQNTSFAGAKLIDGSKSFTTVQSTADKAKLDDFQINQALFGSTGTIVVDSTVNTAASKGELFLGAVEGGLASSTTIEVSGSKGTDVLFLGATSTLANIESAIDILKDSTGVEATKTDAVFGSITAVLVGSNNDLTFTDARTSNGDKTESVTQVLKVVLADPGTSVVSPSIATTSTASELKVTITLGTDNAKAITSSASDIKALIAATANGSDFISASIEGTGAGAVTALASTNITSGAVDAYLTFRSTDFGSAQFVDINVLQGTLTTNLLSTGGTAAGRDAGTDIDVSINGQVARGKGLEASLTSATLEALVTFNSTNNVAAANSKITITGGGSLFQIGQEVSAAGQVGIGIEAINTARLGGVSGKLYELGSAGGKSLLDVSPSLPGADLVAILDEALDDVTGLRGRLGALQKNVFDTNATTLGVAFESISEARSQIVDTDFASETANLTRAQILSQSGISVLAIANQTPSQVLSLLG